MILGKDGYVRYGHSQILAARSSYFDVALQPSWKESSEGVFRKPNIEPRVFDLVLEFIYTDNITVSMDVVSQLTDAAVELGLEALVEGCVEYACKHIAHNTVCDMMVLSDRHRLDRLWNKSTEYFDTFGYDILKEDGILQFDDHLFSKVLMREIYADELTIWGAVVRYCSHRIGLDLNDYPLLTYPSWPGRLLVRTRNAVSQKEPHDDKNDVDDSFDEDSDDEDPLEAKSNDIVVVMPRDQLQQLYAIVKTFLPAVRLTNIPINDFVRCVEGTGLVSYAFCRGLYRYYAIHENYSSKYAFAPPRAAFSTFLPSEQWRTLWSWVMQVMGRPSSLGPPKAIRLYKASKDEFSATSFHKHCDDKGPTLTIALTSTGVIVGGYSSVAWSNRQAWGFSTKTFLFFYDPQTSTLKKCPLVESPSSAVFSSPSLGPTFGDGYSLSISSNGQLSTYKPGPEFTHWRPNLTERFDVTNYEVFGVQPI
ncbi:hypothetical protein BGZ73_003986 [Actinomortierella ambigua]|nr:hypothetical protein BGZ73_003986 [Actinomortierella ambigua]